MTNKLGRNPFAAKAASAKPTSKTEAPRRESSALPRPEAESSLFHRLVIEFPIHMVFVGLKTFVFLREFVQITPRES